MPSPLDRPPADAAGASPMARTTLDPRVAGVGESGDAAIRLKRVLQRLCDRARTTVGADYAVLGAVVAGSEVRWTAASGLELDAWDRRIFPLARAVAAQALAHLRPTSLVLPALAPTTAPGAPERVQSALVVPVTYQGERAVGVVVVGWRTLWPATARHVALAQQVADQAWVALEAARLFEDAAAAQRAAEEGRRRAEESDRAKGMFLATMSHEIRTPLNAVLGYAELLELEIDGPLNAAQRERLAALRRTGHHLLSLVTGILDVAKVEAGEMSVRRDVADLGEVLGAALASVLPQAASGRIRVIDACSEESPVRYVGDADRVRQILVNLLSNAVKFTQAGGQVSVSCQRVTHAPLGDRGEATGPWTRVDVVDTGVGIPPARQLLIFDPFVQGHAPHERAAAGTGLGLTISRRLARLMGGDITLVSAPGLGSRFTLWLPAE